MSMERSDAAMSLSRRTHKSVVAFIEDKKKKRKAQEIRDAHRLFFDSHFPVYITPGEFNHILAKIQLCVMTSSAMH